MDTRSLGVILVIFGLLMLVAQAGTLSGEYLLLALGAVLIAAYYLTGFNAGFLISGSLLTAVTFYGLLTARGHMRIDGGAVFFLFIGLAFAFVYLVEKSVGNNSRWALFPAGGLLVFSGIIYLSESGYVHLQDWGRYWPVIPILAGVWMLLGIGRSDRR